MKHPHRHTLMDALREIAAGSLPDQPAALAGSEYMHAMRWIGHLRGIAHKAVLSEERRIHNRKHPLPVTFEEPEVQRRMRTLEEIRNTPVGLLSDEEIGLLDPAGQAYARNFKVRRAKEAACPGHEFFGSSSREESHRGYHRGACKNCGKDMSYDSGD